MSISISFCAMNMKIIDRVLVLGKANELIMRFAALRQNHSQVESNHFNRMKLWLQHITQFITRGVFLISCYEFQLHTV